MKKFVEHSDVLLPNLLLVLYRGIFASTVANGDYRLLHLNIIDIPFCIVFAIFVILGIKEFFENNTPQWRGKRGRRRPSAIIKFTTFHLG